MGVELGRPASGFGNMQCKGTMKVSGWCQYGFGWCQLDRIERLGLRPVVKPDDAEIDYTAVGWCVAKRHPRVQQPISGGLVPIGSMAIGVLGRRKHSRVDKVDKFPAKRSGESGESMGIQKSA